VLFLLRVFAVEARIFRCSPYSRLPGLRNFLPSKVINKSGENQDKCDKVINYNDWCLPEK